MACTPFILDGGFSTELEERGFLIQGDPLWSARFLYTNPNAVKDVHYSFLQSGSDVVTTATYQASIEGFTRHLGLKPEEAEDLIMSGVRLARESVADFMASCSTKDRKVPLVAGSVGPFGAFLHDGSEYTGVYASSMSVEELKNWHRPQIRCLVAAGVDLLALETIPSLKEAEALVELLREFPDTKAWLAFSCKDAQSISDGNKFAKAVQLASNFPQLVAVGVNCSRPALVNPLLESAKSYKAANMSWVVYPNSGEEWYPSTGNFTIRGESATAQCLLQWTKDVIINDLGCKEDVEDIQTLVALWKTDKTIPFTELSVEWKEQGASWIGGCCRISPADIAQLKSRLTETQNSQS